MSKDSKVIKVKLGSAPPVQATESPTPNIRGTELEAERIAVQSVVERDAAHRRENIKKYITDLKRALTFKLPLPAEADAVALGIIDEVRQIKRDFDVAAPILVHFFDDDEREAQLLRSGIVPKVITVKK